MIVLERESNNHRNYIAMFRLTEKSTRLLLAKQTILVPSNHVIVEEVVNQILSNDPSVDSSADLSLLLPGPQSLEKAMTILEEQLENARTITREKMLERVRVKLPNIHWFMINYAPLIGLEKDGRSHQVENLFDLSRMCEEEGFTNPASKWSSSIETARTNNLLLTKTREVLNTYKGK